MSWGDKTAQTHKLAELISIRRVKLMIRCYFFAPLITSNFCKNCCSSDYKTFEECVPMVSFFSFFKRWERGEFESHQCVNNSSETVELPFISLKSALFPLGVTLPQKSKRILEAASCCWYAQDMQDQPRYATLRFKKTPDKDTLSQRRNAGAAIAGMTNASSFVMIFCRRGFSR